MEGDPTKIGTHLVQAGPVAEPLLKRRVRHVGLGFTSVVQTQIEGLTSGLQLNSLYNTGTI